MNYGLSFRNARRPVWIACLVVTTLAGALLTNARAEAESAIVNGTTDTPGRSANFFGTLTNRPNESNREYTTPIDIFHFNDGTAKPADYHHEGRDRYVLKFGPLLSLIPKANVTRIEHVEEGYLHYLKATSDKGDVQSAAQLCSCYVLGDGVPKDNSQAVHWCSLAAERGSAEAQRRLGLIYEEGNGITQDFVEAVKWYRKAAAQDDAIACWYLGLMYDEGTGIAQDYTEALKYFRKAAEKGLSSAQCSLGLMYSEGKEVTQDYEESLRWYAMAAEQGNSVAQNELGRMYAEGRAVVQDFVLAHMWFNLSSANGDESGRKNREKVAQEMTSEQIAEAQAKAREWIESHN